MDDRVLYVTTQGSQVGVRENQYVVRDVSGSNETGSGPETIGSYPVKKIETINVFGRGVDVTSGTIAAAANHDTPINFFTMHGRHRGHFRPDDTSVAVLHTQQHTLDSDTRLEIAKRLVLGKVVNAHRYVKRKTVAVDDASPLATAPRRIQTADSAEELRGIEGETARQYFGLYEQTLRDGWSMDGRSRRPPGDHVNSLLSLTYTFLRNECEGALRQVNLDPYVGVFHQMRHGRPALALDLIEEFRRAFADPFVARLINRRVVSHDDFTEENQLTDDAFDRYLSKFESYMSEELSHERLNRVLTRRGVIRLQANLLRKRVTGEIDEYPPFEVDR
ncbi:CRISPR-associated endonuclease Cas1 [Halobellus sp. Atlit-31R]|nr:CRISPR-associated endonuclease Cas1 [Halobellus sp. Atlit-31R]